MIKVGILDASGASETPAALSLLSEKERERIGKIKNGKRRSESFFSRLLLKKMYEETFGEEIPEIIYTSKGKPSFKGKKISFSISHDDNLIAVAISDETESIGIDIQSFVGKSRKSDGLEKRFLSGLDSLKGESREDFKIYISFFTKEEKDGDFEIKEREPFENLSYDKNNENLYFLKRWTELEACLKLSGKGFENIKNANKCLQKCKIKTLFFKNRGREYSLTVANE